jgi:tRNA-specific 2-thiouridylase
MSRIVLAMSGGVDSSMAAWLLREQGHEVIGVFMRHGIEPPSCGIQPARPAPRRRGCCTAADADDARRVADLLGIRFYALDFQREFARIVDYFVEEYSVGRTPNPCIVCNIWLKFGKLFEYARNVGAEQVATGHHARIEPSENPAEPALCRGRDEAKDQSYVLFGVDRRQLPCLNLPVGHHTKDEIRRLAIKLRLPVADKRDSQEICFVPDHDHPRLVRQHRGDQAADGEIVTTSGEVVGRHDGLERFTVGQRKGLGIAFGQRRYVVRLEADQRRVVVGTHEELARTELVARQANWLVEEPAGPVRCQVKIRYRSPASWATVEPSAGRSFRAVFDEPRYGVAPGQAAVCYLGDRVLGGGWIE